VAVVADATGIPFASEAKALLAVITAASAIDPEELTMTRLLFKAVFELVPPCAIFTTPFKEIFGLVF
jgi:hypothetical protein